MSIGLLSQKKNISLEQLIFKVSEFEMSILLSYSSFFQKARLAFAEKGVRYKSHLVNLATGEVHSLKYLENVNPKGTVPAMEHLGDFFTDSKDIIEYVDSLPSESRYHFK